MCGRYHIDEGLQDDIMKLVQSLDDGLQGWRAGDIHPSEYAPVIRSRQGSLCASAMKWGFTGRDKRLLINARAETALARATFSDSAMHRRCIVPASWFYEWDRHRQKAVFRHIDRSPLYMAGFYQNYEDGLHFIIATCDANESVRPVHERMPLILMENEIAPWIREDAKAGSFLGGMSPILKCSREFEQISLFDTASG